MDPVTFQRKWIVNTLKERSASQSHFNDLCEWMATHGWINGNDGSAR